MIENLSLMGYSGHSFVCAEVALLIGYKLEGYIELNEKKINPFNIPYLGNGKNIIEGSSLFVAIGDNVLRRKLFLEAIMQQVTLPNLIHPKAIISNYVKIGVGSLICAGSIVNPYAKIGSGVIINTGSIVEHECQIDDFSHIAPGAVLAGNVKIGELCFIGANAVIRQGVSICSNVTIGMGAVVTKDITEPGTYVGSPARKLIK
jgi:sugar O-acyltransferase (sialic acid O-acetyltransferase NeuD family)